MIGVSDRQAHSGWGARAPFVVPQGVPCADEFVLRYLAVSQNPLRPYCTYVCEWIDNLHLCYDGAGTGAAAGIVVDTKTNYKVQYIDYDYKIITKINVY